MDVNSNVRLILTLGSLHHTKYIFGFDLVPILPIHVALATLHTKIVSDSSFYYLQSFIYYFHVKRKGEKQKR